MEQYTRKLNDFWQSRLDPQKIIKNSLFGAILSMKFSFTTYLMSTKPFFSVALKPLCPQSPFSGAMQSPFWDLLIKGFKNCTLTDEYFLKTFAFQKFSVWSHIPSSGTTSDNFLIFSIIFPVFLTTDTSFSECITMIGPVVTAQ